ncbi:unnamed protein product [Acanthoscelides obtectus]|uniref:Uncharacterized protein n=1 Tax=Acanthoscelides obtectus TaxID=200917 RepID=A0A9P0NR13_ACAOB|nr:unnamed protein product [Acanthoscelides obtectus]CAK1672772.1 CDK5 regulatory subunit-associated protein 1 [Acanthoscelides obtectus]
MNVSFSPRFLNNIYFKHSWYKHRLQLYRLFCSHKTCSNHSPDTSNVLEPELDRKTKFKHKLLEGPNLKDFFKDEHLASQEHLPEEEVAPYLRFSPKTNIKRKVYLDVYGCQMNVNDAEIVLAILKNNDFEPTKDLIEADVILILTCAIRDSAEEKIWGRLGFLKGLKRTRKKDRPSLKIGLLGCMAERLKTKVLETSDMVDLVAGPDSYRDLPRLLSLTDTDQRSVNVLLSLDETYADISPVVENSISAYVSIMRGCDNMCTYCIVPFTRGRERSRPVSSILREVEQLSEKGVKEVTLLGQNVNSYRLVTYNTKNLLNRVAAVNPEMRIRFTSPHPKDFPDEVVEVNTSY